MIFQKFRQKYSKSCLFLFQTYSGKAEGKNKPMKSLTNAKISLFIYIGVLRGGAKGALAPPPKIG